MCPIGRHIGHIVCFGLSNRQHWTKCKFTLCDPVIDNDSHYHSQLHKHILLNRIMWSDEMILAGETRFVVGPRKI